MKMINIKRTSYDIVSEAINNYYDRIRRYPDIVCFFKQRYTDDEWESVELLVTTDSPNGYDEPTTITCEYDFCEGQTEVKNLYIFEHDSVLAFAHEKIEELEDFNERRNTV